MAAGPTFVLCIENNAIRPQALLLCDSIRTFGGRYRHAPIIAVAPRPGLGVDASTRRRLEALDVEYVELPLNHACPEYGSANRVYAAAWAEGRCSSDWIIVLDSDTVFLEEPQLPEDDDVAVRPVDSKVCTSEGPDDPFDEYWAHLAALQGVPLEILPFIETTDRTHRVRASYNGGLIVVRRSCRVLEVWAELFSRSVAAGLKPLKGRGLNVFASTGYVGEVASEFWGSNQAALAFAIWSTTRRVQQYPDSHNVPLHLLAARDDLAALPRTLPLVHVHYHWLFAEPDHVRALTTLRLLGLSPDRVDWLAARLPLR